MRQYETAELTFSGPPPADSDVEVDLRLTLTAPGGSVTVKGFYAGGGIYKARFLPEEAGTVSYRAEGSALGAPTEGRLTIEPAAGARHGPVRAEGTHLRCADGTRFSSFGTTVYALAHQSDALIRETMRTLAGAPFNKVRLCLFPKDYNYNKNEPPFYPFERREDGGWDVHHPCFAFWDAFEAHLRELDSLGIQADLILFHPYDRWGFATMPMEDNLVYLDYLIRRFAAFPNVWWSLANEYDLCIAKSEADWEAIERFVAGADPFHHLLSNHNCFRMWDAGREAITHVSWQSKQLHRVASLMRQFGKPVLIDECRYEGNLPEFWGNISGPDMVQRFWRVTVQGGYCTHGETFLPGTAQAERATETGETDVVWWAKGGRLSGESPARIAFLREIVESLPGPLEPNPRTLSGMIGMDDGAVRAMLEQVPEQHRVFFSRLLAMDREERDAFFAVEYSYEGHCGEDAWLYYKDDQCCARAAITLPENRRYRVEVIDTWEMTRTVALEDASGTVTVDLPGKPYMAILAVRNDAA